MEFVYLADYPEAIPIIAKWYYNQWGHLHGLDSQKTSEEMLADYLSWDTMPLLILAREEDEIIGAVQLKYYEMDIYPQKEHWLGGVYVVEQHRGKKIAEKLVLRAMDTAKSFGVDTLYLQTEKIDGGLYKRLTWKPVEKVKYRNKHVLIMKKVLESAIANAENNHGLDVDELVVADAFVGKNIILKRGRPRARGRFGKILKPFSELTIKVRQVPSEEEKS